MVGKIQSLKFLARRILELSTMSLSGPSSRIQGLIALFINCSKLTINHPYSLVPFVLFYPESQLLVQIPLIQLNDLTLNDMLLIPFEHVISHLVVLGFYHGAVDFHYEFDVRLGLI